MIHLVNPLWNAWGGSERRTMALFDLLRPRADVLLWSEHEVHPAIDRPVRRIGPDGFPLGGTLVVVGVYFPLGPWLARARPERAILVYNTFEPTRLQDALRALDGRAELVYASELLKRHTGLPGEVQLSPIDTELFSPRPRPPGEDFVVGRHSRDVPEKHHPDAPAFYRRLLDAGCRVRVLGGRCLPDTPGLERLPEGSEPAAEFLRGLDAFTYRTHDRWLEPFGRVVMEALACGLPVVAERRGGYAPFVRRGLFDSDAEAVDLLLALKDNPGGRASTGAENRRAALEAYGPAWRESTFRYYMGRGVCH